MKHLKTYEGFEVGDFTTFINKYKKSGGYVSKGDIKRLDASDVKYEYFKRMERDIDNCISFYNRNDFELLEDLLLDVYDECPFIDRTGTFKYFEMRCYPRNYWRNEPFDFVVSEDAKSISSREHIKISDKDKILDTVIDKSVKSLQSQIDKEKESIKTDQSGRPGKDPISVLALRELSKSNPFKKLEINPVLKLDFKSRSNWDDDNSEDNWGDFHGGWDSPKKVEERERDAKVIKFTTEYLKRYFSAIGYEGVEFKVSSSNSYGTYYNPNYRVDVKLNQYKYY